MGRLNLNCFQIIEPIDGAIPEDVKDFISVGALLDEIVDLFVGGPIEKSKGSKTFNC